MGQGDILLLFTDGFTDQKFGQFNYITQRLEDHLRQVKYLSAQEIVQSIKSDFNQIAGRPDDDATLIVVKKN
jgi:serine phosphatase RsbU (regulator of sigma subunit)